MSSAELDVQESLAALESMLDNGAATASNLVSDEPVTSHEERIKFIRELPKLTERDIQDLDDVCPICQDTFLSVIALEEMAYAMDSPGLPEENLGVTKLSCGHRFCRKDLTMWTASKESAPTMNSIQYLSNKYDALGTPSSSPTKKQLKLIKDHQHRHPSSGSSASLTYPTSLRTLRHWVYAQWAVWIFLRRVASGADLLVDVDDRDEAAKRKGKGKETPTMLELNVTEVEDEGDGLEEEEPSPSRAKAARARRERARVAATTSATTVDGDDPSAAGPSTSKSAPTTTDSPTMTTTLPAFSSSAFSLEEDTSSLMIPKDASSPTFQFTPPTPHTPPVPLPAPKTLLLNPYAGSFLTKPSKASKRRSKDLSQIDDTTLSSSSTSPTTSNTTPPPSRALTPTSSSLASMSMPRSAVHRPKTLILDLDETLIHSTSKAPAQYHSSYGQGLFSAGGLGFGIGSSAGFGFGGSAVWGARRGGPGHMVEVVLGGRSTLYHVYKRPYVDYFLKKVSTWYTLVIFTASMQEYADPVIDWLDAGRGILAKRFFRESCTQLSNGSYSKDLTIVEGDLARVALLDNSPVSYSTFPANGIPIEGWTSDPHDEALLDLLPFLDSLRFTSDVRRVLGIRGF
ncbi:Nuclear envelope morphology protein 1 [Tulasnella sp. 330]|nr:Nuclear envelope morphology protein 1 [Tulasnella sp. 330]